MLLREWPRSQYHVTVFELSEHVRRGHHPDLWWRELGTVVVQVGVEHHYERHYHYHYVVEPDFNGMDEPWMLPGPDSSNAQRPINHQLKHDTSRMSSLLRHWRIRVQWTRERPGVLLRELPDSQLNLGRLELSVQVCGRRHPTLRRIQLGPLPIPIHKRLHDRHSIRTLIQLSRVLRRLAVARTDDDGSSRPIHPRYMRHVLRCLWIRISGLGKRDRMPLRECHAVQPGRWRTGECADGLRRSVFGRSDGEDNVWRELEVDGVLRCGAGLGRV